MKKIVVKIYIVNKNLKYNLMEVTNMAKKTEVARWKSIITKLDYKMTKEKLERAKIVKNVTSNQKGKRK